MTTISNSADAERRARHVQGRSSVLLAGLVGLLSGLVLDGALWLWAFASVLDGRRPVDLPPVVHADVVSGDPTVVGGPGVLLLPIGLTVVATAAARVARRRSDRDHASGEAGGASAT